MIVDMRRNELEIVYELLLSTKECIKKTRLMYITNLNYVNFSKYLDYLVTHNFIDELPGKPTGKVYKISEKGLGFVDKFNGILQLVGK